MPLQQLATPLLHVYVAQCGESRICQYTHNPNVPNLLSSGHLSTFMVAALVCFCLMSSRFQPISKS